MTFKSIIISSLCAFTLPATFSSAAFADVIIHDAYARSSGATAKTGAAFFTIMNTGEIEDRLIDVSTAAAKIVQLHTHISGENGVMMMREDQDGFEVASGGIHSLKRGGDHVMMMDLTEPFVQGADLELVLTFEQAGDIAVTVPVDNEREPEEGAHSTLDHSTLNHSEMDHDASGENIDHSAMGH